MWHINPKPITPEFYYLPYCLPTLHLTILFSFLIAPVIFSILLILCSYSMLYTVQCPLLKHKNVLQIVLYMWIRFVMGCVSLIFWLVKILYIFLNTLPLERGATWGYFFTTEVGKNPSLPHFTKDANLSYPLWDEKSLNFNFSEQEKLYEDWFLVSFLNKL